MPITETTAQPWAAARRAATVLFTVAGLGCASARVQPYMHIRNGGIGPTSLGCDAVALTVDDSGVHALAPGAPGCDGEDAPLGPPLGAAYAYARITTARAPAGPVVSNPVELGILPSLTSGGSGRGLASGASDRGLASGASQRGLMSGASDRGLTSGASDRGLAAGASQRGLTSGASDRGLVAGASDRGLASGASDRGLAAGASDRALSSGASGRVPFSLRKAVSPATVHEGDETSFSLTFDNDGTAAVDRLVIVDRVAPTLRVVDSGGAHAYVLDDSSTLLVWDLRVSIPPRANHTVGFRALVRSARELE